MPFDARLWHVLLTNHTLRHRRSENMAVIEFAVNELDVSPPSQGGAPRLPSGRQAPPVMSKRGDQINAASSAARVRDDASNGAVVGR